MKGGYQLIDCHGANLHENGITIDGIFEAINRNHGKNIILTNFILLGVLCADTAVECQFNGSTVYEIPYFFGKKIIINADDELTVSDLGYVTETQMENAIENAVEGLIENPMTEEGDIIYGGDDGEPNSLERGTAGQVLTIDADTLLPKWETLQAGGTKLYRHTITFASSVNASFKVIQFDGTTGEASLVTNSSMLFGFEFFTPDEEPYDPNDAKVITCIHSSTYQLVKVPGPNNYVLQVYKPFYDSQYLVLQTASTIDLSSVGFTDVVTPL